MTNELSCEEAEHATLNAGALGLMIDFRHHLERTHELPTIPSGISLVQLVGMHQRMHEQLVEDGRGIVVCRNTLPNDLAWQEEYVDYLQGRDEFSHGLGDFDGGGA